MCHRKNKGNTALHFRSWQTGVHCRVSWGSRPHLPAFWRGEETRINVLSVTFMEEKSESAKPNSTAWFWDKHKYFREESGKSLKSSNNKWILLLSPRQRSPETKPPPPSASGLSSSWPNTLGNVHSAMIYPHNTIHYPHITIQFILT